MGNLLESVWCWKSRRGHDWDYSINFLCKHKTVATLEPIRGVGQTHFCRTRTKVEPRCDVLLGMSFFMLYEGALTILDCLV